MLYAYHIMHVHAQTYTVSVCLCVITCMCVYVMNVFIRRTQNLAIYRKLHIKLSKYVEHSFSMFGIKG